MDIPGSYGQPALDLLDLPRRRPDNFPETGSSAEPRAAHDAAVPGARTGASRHAGAEPGELAEPWTHSSPGRRARPRRRRRSCASRTGTTDWIAAKHGRADDQQKKAILSRITQKQYYMDYIGRAGAGDPASTSATGTACSARARRRSRRATCGRSRAGLPGPRPRTTTRSPASAARRSSAAARDDGAASPTWPDGNSSLLRLLVDRLIPGAVSRPRRRGARPGERRQRDHRLLQARPPRQRRPDPPQEPRLPRQAGRLEARHGDSASASPRSTT